MSTGSNFRCRAWRSAPRPQGKKRPRRGASAKLIRGLERLGFRTIALDHADPEHHALSQDKGHGQGRLGKPDDDSVDAHDAVLQCRGELLRWGLQCPRSALATNAIADRGLRET